MLMIKVYSYCTITDELICIWLFSFRCLAQAISGDSPVQIDGHTAECSRLPCISAMN